MLRELKQKGQDGVMWDSFIKVQLANSGGLMQACGEVSQGPTRKPGV